MISPDREYISTSKYPTTKKVFTTDPTHDESRKFIQNRRENIKTDLIEITHDKLENILLKHLMILRYRTSWITPLSIFIAILAIILTTSFNEFFGIKAATWEATYHIICVSMFIWLIYDFFKLYKNWNKTTIEFLINKIKGIE